MSSSVKQKRITRRDAQTWLDPVRRCFVQMLTGEIETIQGYPVTRLRPTDPWARVHVCLAGFRALHEKLLPELDHGVLLRIESRLEDGVPLEPKMLQDGLALLRKIESGMMRYTREQVASAVRTEQIRFEVENLGLIETSE